MRSIRYTTALLFSLLVSGAVFQACSSSAKEQKEQEKAIPVVTALPSTAEGSKVLASGQIEAGQTAVISTRVMGTISHISVKVGDKVTKGQLLVSISNADMLAQRAQADAAIAEAKAATAVSARDVERFKQLYQQQSASAKELENVTLQYQSVSSKLETAMQMKNQVNAMLAYTRITAPFSGVITKKFMDAGTISEISPSSQFTGGQYGVKVAITDSKSLGIKAGMYVNVLIPGETVKGTQAGSMTVPLAAIVNKEQLTGVYVASNDHVALLRWIRLGKQMGDRVEVLSGLAPTDRVVVSSPERIYNGVKVNESK